MGTAAMSLYLYLIITDMLSNCTDSRFGKKQKWGNEMYRCLRCNGKFDNSELSHIYSYRGECHGRPAYEREPCCPECGYEVEDAEKPEENDGG